MGKDMNKLRVQLPLFKSMAVKPNLQRLICAKANLQAYKVGDRVKLVRGTRVEEVSERQLAEEVEAYERSHVDDDVGIERRLGRVGRRHRKGDPVRLVE